MNIVGVAACTAGIAHTYIAKEKLINAAEKAGHKIHVETQGEEEIAQADVVILAIDVAISGKERFKGKKTVEVPTEMVVHSPNALIAKIEEIVKG